MIPWGWVVAALLTGVYGGLLMAGMMKQASDADACLGCYWRQVGMRWLPPVGSHKTDPFTALDIDGCDLGAEHNICAEDAV